MKIIVFLPIIIFFAVFGLLIAGFIFIVVKIMFKTKNSYWKGEVIDKSMLTKKEDNNRKVDYLTLVVRTTDGQQRNIAVSRDLYDSCAVGDQIEKPLGKLNPVKI